jgi:hypothetical protein
MSKQIRLWLAALAAGFVAGPALNVQAAGDAGQNLTTVSAGYDYDALGQTAATADSVAEFDLTGGTLALTAVPNLHFSSGRVQDLITGDLTLHADQQAVASRAAGYDGNDAQQLEVTDYRGTNSGWQVTAKLGAFQHVGEASAPLTATSIELAQGTVAGDKSAGIAVSASNFSQDASAVLAAAPSQGSSTTTATITAATLALPKTPDALAGQYQATINWALAATPTPEIP